VHRVVLLRRRQEESEEEMKIKTPARMMPPATEILAKCKVKGMSDVKKNSLENDRPRSWWRLQNPRRI